MRLKKIKKQGGFAIYVAFPDKTASIGSSDKSFIANMGRKLLGNIKLPVGHTGIVIGDGNGTTSYYDFGRFDDNDLSRGIVRTQDKIKGVNLIGGNSSDARDIVKSLINGDHNYFGTEKYGAVTFAVHPGLDYNNMKSAADGYGSRPFGFGDGQSFCTQFVHDIINAGGGGLPKISDEIIKNKGALMKAIILGGGNLRKVAEMDIAPTPGNFVKKIRSQFRSSNTGNNSLNTN